MCAPIAPYLSDHSQESNLISSYGGYIEVFVNTSLEVCESRDSKGLYKLAREGKLKGLQEFQIPMRSQKIPR